MRKIGRLWTEMMFPRLRHITCAQGSPVFLKKQEVVNTQPGSNEHSEALAICKEKLEGSQREPVKSFVLFCFVFDSLPKLKPS